MVSRLIVALLVCVCLSVANGQVAERTAGRGEFPALQLLPPGSVVRGISLPRYEGHRVTALLRADLLEVISRYEVRMKKIHTTLYHEKGETTNLRMPGARYNFRTQMLSARTGPVSMQNPRYNAQAAGLLFHSATRRGVLTGPVKTLIYPAAVSASAES